MDAVRIKLMQRQANYRREETIINKMTYPLPPYSTVIGAIHKACGYTEYHPMDISIQGKYKSMQKETYVDYAFLNSTMNDRGILVKMKNPAMLSTAYDVAAKACSQGADFEKEDKIEIVNQNLLDEYKKLREQKRTLESKKKETVDPEIKRLKDILKNNKTKIKSIEKNSEEYKKVLEENQKIEQNLKSVQENYSTEKDRIDQQYGKFATLTKSLKYYEVLYDVELVIHILSDEETMNDILTHANDIQAIGRSEDFVQVESAEYVDLMDHISENKRSVPDYSAYIPCRACMEMDETDVPAISIVSSENSNTVGTRYSINKNYEINGNKRIFHKKNVLYTSGYSIDDESCLGKESGVYFDGDYIVALI